jgi:alpha-tubulin suppressor-like RCC1 family protein
MERVISRVFVCCVPALVAGLPAAAGTLTVWRSLGEPIRTSELGPYRVVCAPEATVLLDSIGRAAGWGLNTYSVLDGVSTWRWRDIAVSERFGIGVDEGGTCYLWGQEPSTAPATFPAWSGARDVEVNDGGFVVLLANGRVSGLDPYAFSMYGEASDAPGTSTFTMVRTFSRHVLALAQDGSVVAWGRDWSGECQVPASVSSVLEVAAGEYHSVARMASGVVRCWGSDAAGQCSPPQPITDAFRIAAGGRHTAVLRTDGTVTCFGSNLAGQSAVPPEATGIVSIGCGRDHTVAIDGSLRAVSWGLGAGFHLPPPQVYGSLRVLAAGGRHALFVSDAGFSGWGDNGHGQSRVPSFLADGAGVISASAGGAHSMALTSDGSVFAWGDDCWGQATVPSGMLPCVAISAGVTHSLALDVYGDVQAWGNEANGLCAVPSTVRGATAIAAGGLVSAAALADGRVVRWGLASGDSAVGALRVACGQDFAVAMRADGTVWNATDNTDVADAVAIDAEGAVAVVLRADGSVVPIRGASVWNPSPGVAGASRCARISSSPPGSHPCAPGTSMETGPWVDPILDCF